MPRRMSVTPVASQTRTPPGTGDHRRARTASTRASAEPSTSRSTITREPSASAISIRPVAGAAPAAASARGGGVPGRLDNHRHQATGPASLLAKLTPPGEHQVGVHVVAPRHNRHGNPGLVAPRYNPTLLGIAPATTRGNRAFPPGPQLLHCFRHLRSCPLGPWWTPPWCPLPIA